MYVKALPTCCCGPGGCFLLLCPHPLKKPQNHNETGPRLLVSVNHGTWQSPSKGQSHLTGGMLMEASLTQGPEAGGLQSGKSRPAPKPVASEGLTMHMEASLA